MRILSYRSIGQKSAIFLVMLLGVAGHAEAVCGNQSGQAGVGFMWEPSTCDASVYNLTGQVPGLFWSNGFFGGTPTTPGTYTVNLYDYAAQFLYSVNIVIAGNGWSCPANDVNLVFGQSNTVTVLTGPGCSQACTWGNGGMPPGMSFVMNGGPDELKITGTPTVAGTYNLTLGSCTNQFDTCVTTIVVSGTQACYGPFTWTKNVPVNIKVMDGYVVGQTSGNYPPGVQTFAVYNNQIGGYELWLNGAPSTVGTYTKTFGQAPDTCSVVITVVDEGVCACHGPFTWTVGQALNATTVFSGLTQGQTTVVSGGLPPGMTGQWDVDEYQALGTPTTAGTYTMVFKATDDTSGPCTVTMVVNPGVCNCLGPFNYQVNQVVGQVTLVTGTAPGPYHASGTLPPGMQWVSGSGEKQMSGGSTGPTTQGQYTIDYSLTPGGPVECSVTINVGYGTLTCPEDRLVWQYTAMQCDLGVGITGPFPDTCAVTGLPPGVTHTPGTQTINGVPSATGVFLVTVAWGYTGGPSGSCQFTITVQANVSPCGTGEINVNAGQVESTMLGIIDLGGAACDGSNQGQVESCYETVSVVVNGAPPGLTHVFVDYLGRIGRGLAFGGVVEQPGTYDIHVTWVVHSTNGPSWDMQQRSCNFRLNVFSHSDQECVSTTCLRLRDTLDSLKNALSSTGYDFAAFQAGTGAGAVVHFDVAIPGQSGTTQVSLNMDDESQSTVMGKFNALVRPAFKMLLKALVIYAMVASCVGTLAND